MPRSSKTGTARASQSEPTMPVRDPTVRSGRLGALARVPMAGCFVAACAGGGAPPVEVALDVPETQPTPRSRESRAPSPDGCELHGSGLSRRFQLALAPGGKPFAEVTRARTVTVRLERDGIMSVTLDAGGVTLAGFADPNETPLYASAPMVVAGAIVPLGWSGLRFVDAGTDGVEVSLGPDALPKLVTGLDEAPAKGTTPCSNLALVPGSFPVGAAIPRPAVGVAMLDGEAVLLSREPGGDAALTLWPAPDAPPSVHVLERARGETRIAWVLDESVVFGWIDDEHLLPTEARPHVPVPHRSSTVDPTVRAPTRMRCLKPVPVMAEVDGAARFIGHVEAGKVLGIEMNGSEGFLLGVDGASFHPYSYSELRIRAGDLAGCVVLE